MSSLSHEARDVVDVSTLGRILLQLRGPVSFCEEAEGAGRERTLFSSYLQYYVAVLRDYTRELQITRKSPKLKDII
jgi:ribosomal protein L27